MTSTTWSSKVIPISSIVTDLSTQVHTFKRSCQVQCLAVPIADAMSAAIYSHMDHMQRHALKQADHKYQAYTARIRDAVQEKNRVNAKQCYEMRMISNLSAALDLTRRKSWEFEGTSAETDKILEDHTGDDGESWFYTYHNAGEEIEKAMIQKCIKVAALASQWDLLTDQVKKLNKEQDEYGDKLVKKAEQKEESK